MANGFTSFLQRSKLIHDATHLPGTPLFRADNVTVRYGDTVALDAVSFELNTGEQVAVVGPNGAGKSTLFRLMVGEIRPNSGTVTLYGSTPTDHLCVAYVPQRKAIDWRFPVTVTDVVMMGRVRKIGLFRHPGRRDRDLVRDSLERVNIAPLADKQIGELSGGQQQRVFIARALAQEAELLLLDEPLTGLDMPSQERFFNLLDAVSDSGVTTIIATHDLNLAARQFDQVMLLNTHLVAIGAPEQVLSAENLAAAYGGHLHTVGDVIIADTCCEE
ncbi:MAG: metal ABC transporter ATP-binding protein [Anaerolineae bacterium]|nr:metal ABC transporter ATP-binding protein [Anaerolineae bacterium]MCO5187627.1 metal ABC transporter ATP-binding protein [Anaerolineae bacterium]MCO5194289.1 metal ABC transporter ATP-binding protein [Anaerolineae bacterium]MCO5197359.1 metal ABC transporter ATP-binding protein [Anaerolineae bacterium]MCO5205009.1 metal ABC transporter ATP-binding protein [Anaerolineae bacterium]